MTRVLEIFPYILAVCLIGATSAGILIAVPYSGENVTIDVGVLVPLTGDLAVYGGDVLEGINIAVDEINEGGGIGGKDVRIICRDTGGDPDRAAAMMEDLADQGVPVVIGPVTSSSAISVAPIAEKKQIVMISPTATTPLLSGAGRYVYRTISSDTYQGRGMATVLRSLHPEVNSVAVLYIENTYGAGLRESFTAAWTTQGGTVVCEIPFENGRTDFSAVIAAVRDSDADAVALISYLPEAKAIFREAARQELGGPWIASDAIVTAEFIAAAGPATEGIVATIQANQVQSPSFITEYCRRTNATSVNWQAAYAYDTMMIIAEAIEHGGYTADGIRNHLDVIRYLGICGPKVFDENGDIPPAFDVMRIRDGRWTRVPWTELAEASEVRQH
ncbi:hypothetical protein AZH53_08060 [Methanomicrobiaceae archaeon CYW5]|uniref:ABC transporter substrate-binding protein n=1 Tax=Methanovulcanius yangii TaxID=1789227 RepID=UPI0029C9CF4C|nr:ABC transporter substrate-binding protein [Methanovulcanius yangii]MBT8508356.1 hypothetical protein [Methanovulcanius yangii]